jgi:quinoprotein glucose dehydrogenase
MSDASGGIGLFVLRLYALVLLAIGIALAAGGGYLVSLHGSPYYVLTGIAVIVSAVLLWMRKGEGALLYGLMLLATIAWALWEAGYDGWLLMTRVLAPVVLGVVLLVPAVRRALIRRTPPWSPARNAIAVVGAVVVGAALHSTVPPLTYPNPIYQTGIAAAPTIPAPAAQEAPSGDWLHYGNDSGGSRFSPLAQITPANAGQLELAWTARIGDAVKNFGFETTAIKVDRTLYMCTSSNEIYALDAETGKQEWSYSPGADPSKVTLRVCRGVSYYKVPDATGACAERIYTNTIDARLVAVDARDGKPCADFGSNGEVSLLTGMGDVPNAYYYVTSAPTIIHGKIIIGGWVADNQYWGEPSGVIRAFDTVTGKLAWAWDMGAPDRLGEPPAGETYTRSTPNSWGPMSADEKLGLVYVPTGNAPPDYYGVFRRPFDEKYSSAVVALDADNGRPRWVFQTTHHDLWDYDLPSQPTLVDIPTADGVVPALIQPTKRGELFVLNRVTGEPVKAVEERKVPTAGALPDEPLSPTQPFSAGVPSFRGPRLTETSMWGITPLDQLWCRVKFREARFEGTLTPPGLTPSVQQPSMSGGMEWGSAAVDAPRAIAVINTMETAAYVRLITRAEADKRGMKRITNADSGRRHVGTEDAQENTPYAILTGPWLSPLHVPCTPPPFGRLSAVDLPSGKLLWTRPFGTAKGAGPMYMRSGLPFTIGTPNIGGAVVTQGGVFFIGAAQDGYLRAYETATGKELWRYNLPAGGQATPMTYLSPESGRQFVVIAAGGAQAVNAKSGNYIMGFALSKTSH